MEPYRGAESHVLSNGLLLRSDLHTLFDLHLIGADASGRRVVSSKLDGYLYRIPRPGACHSARFRGEAVAS